MMKRDLLIVFVLAVIAAGWLIARTDRPDDRREALDTTQLLNTAPENFRRVTGPAPLRFPEDHAAHPGYRNEWWYFTGNLADDTGHRFGYQFTLFRFGLDGQAPVDSDFSSDAVWMAHLALSDLTDRRFLSRERFARGALGLAGATSDQWWLRDWTVTRSPQGWRLQARTEAFGLDLQLDPEKPVVLQGDRGYSRKGGEPGNASRYYSITRLAADGTIRIGDRSHQVTGLSWLDREWGSSQLGEGIEGWDWFALQLDDGRDLMLYRLRDRAGRASPFSAGMRVATDATPRPLERADFELTPTRFWRDAQGVEWPVEWEVALPSESLNLEVRAVFDEQRWGTSVEYWEGAVEVFDRDDGEPVGRGYLELSGYSN